MTPPLFPSNARPVVLKSRFTLIGEKICAVNVLVRRSANEKHSGNFSFSFNRLCNQGIEVRTGWIAFGLCITFGFIARWEKKMDAIGPIPNPDEQELNKAREP